MATVKFNPYRHRRRSIRLKGYDYGQPGAYFVTICVQNRACLLGEVRDREMALSHAGLCVENCWQRLSQSFHGISLDAFVVMPNHFHGIVILHEDASVSLPQHLHARPGTQHNSLGAIIQNFKSVSTRRINRLNGQKGLKFWQRNYYEHIIRNEASLARIRHYIQDNPRRWDVDQLHPGNPSKW